MPCCTFDVSTTGSGRIFRQHLDVILITTVIFLYAVNGHPKGEL